MEILTMTSALMPSGKPNFPAIIQYPTISKIIDEGGRADMTKAVFILIKNFCESINCVRNMNEDQMIEAAAFLIDECGNLRLEDYTMMFAMAKRGDLVKILDRVDIQVIAQARDQYMIRRTAAGEAEQEREYMEAEGLLAEGDRTDTVFIEGKGYERKKTDADHISGFLSNIRNAAGILIDAKREIDQSKKEIHERGKQK